MTYSFHDQEDQSEAQENARSADRMATLILILMVVWIFGAAVMFTAAYRGTTISAVGAADSQPSAPATAAPAETP